MPATNPTAAALARLLSTDAGYTYGNVLPLAKNNTTGALSPAMPGMVRSGLQGLADAVTKGIPDLVNMRTAPSAQPGVNTLTPDSLGALMGMPAAGVAPAGAVATGAVRRAALPMDEASRMARAAEQGYDLGRPLYRGTVNRGEKSAAPSFEAGRGVFMTDSPDVADIFRYPREYGEVLFDENPGDLQELYARVKNPLVLDERTAQRFSDDTAFQVQVMKEAAAKGHDGIVAPNVKEGVGDTTERGTTVVAMNPNQVRLRTAAFDPAKKDSADLLASRSPGYPLAWQQQEEVSDRKKLARALSKVQK